MTDVRYWQSGSGAVCHSTGTGDVISLAKPEECKQRNPLVDDGMPCIKDAGHLSRDHVTINAKWWNNVTSSNNG